MDCVQSFYVQKENKGPLNKEYRRGILVTTAETARNGIGIITEERGGVGGCSWRSPSPRQPTTPGYDVDVNPLSNYYGKN